MHTENVLIHKHRIVLSWCIKYVDKILFGLKKDNKMINNWIFLKNEIVVSSTDKISYSGTTVVWFEIISLK